MPPISNQYNICPNIANKSFTLHFSVDMKPSDIGLLGILEMLPLWTEYAIPLGLSINRVKYYQELPQENMRGLLALQYWRDGLCGSSYPGTWKFLLTVIEDKLGHNVAENLQTKITANRAWRLSSQTGGLGSLLILIF